MTACVAVNYKLSRHYLVMQIADQTEIQLSIAFSFFYLMCFYGSDIFVL